MSGQSWYKRYPTDFINKTMGLTLEEKGAYSLCLDLIYAYGGPIADDPRWLAGICNVSTRKWTSIRDALIGAGKLHVEDGRLMNRRAGMVLSASKRPARNSAEDQPNPSRKADELLANQPRKVREASTKGALTSAENEGQSNDISELSSRKIAPREDNIREEQSREDTSELTVPRNPRQHDWPRDYPEVFWRLYPRHDDKKAAMTALTGVYRSGKVDWQTIVDGVERLKAFVEPKFHPYPAKWLKHERWTDEHQRQPNGLFGDQNRPGFAGRMNGTPPARISSGERLVEGLREVMEHLPDDE